MAARFPGFEEQIRLSPGSPQAISSTSDARQMGEDVSRLGQQMMQAGLVAAEVQAEKAGNDATILAEEAHQEAKMTAKPDGSDFQNIAMQKYNEKISKLSLGLDPLVASKASSFLGKLKANTQVGAMETALSMKNFNNEKIGKENAEELGKKARDYPDQASQMLIDTRIKYQGMVEKNIYSPTQANALFEISSQSIAHNSMEGLIAQGRLGEATRQLGGSEQQLTLDMSAEDVGIYGLKSDGTLKIPYIGKDKKEFDADLSEVLRRLSPKDKDMYLDKIKAIHEKNTGIKLSQIKDYVDSVAYKSNFMGQPTKEDIRKGYAMISASGLPPEQKQQYAEMLQETAATAPFMQKGREFGVAAAINDLTKAKPEATGKNLVADVKVEKAYRKTLAALDQLSQIQKADPGQDAVDNSPEIRAMYGATKNGDPESTSAYIAAKADYQRKKGLDDTILLGDEKKVMAFQLKASIGAGSEVATEYVQGIKSKYGQYALQVMNEIQQHDKSIDSSVVLLPSLSNQYASTAVLENMKYKEQINKNWAAKFSSEDEKSFNESISTELDKVASDMFGSNDALSSLPFREAIRTQIITEAKQQMILKGVSESDAIESASKTMVASNFSFLKSGSNNLYQPKNLGNPVLTQRFLYNNDPKQPFFHTKTKMTEDYPVESLRVTSKKSGELTPVNESYYRENARWANTPEMDGIQLIMSDGVSWHVLKNEFGRNVIIKFKDLSNYDSATAVPKQGK